MPTFSPDSQTTFERRTHKVIPHLSETARLGLKCNHFYIPKLAETQIEEFTYHMIFCDHGAIHKKEPDDFFELEFENVFTKGKVKIKAEWILGRHRGETEEFLRTLISAE